MCIKCGDETVKTPGRSFESLESEGPGECPLHFVVVAECIPLARQAAGLLVGPGFGALGLAAANSVAEVVDGDAETFVESDFRFPAQNAFGFGDIGLPDFRIIGRQRFVIDLYIVAEARLDLFRKLQDGHLDGVTEIHRVAFVGFT